VGRQRRLVHGQRQARLDPAYVAEIVQAWLPLLKGTTLMVDNSREQAPYTRITEAEYEAAKKAEIAEVADGIDRAGASSVSREAPAGLPYSTSTEAPTTEVEQNGALIVRLETTGRWDTSRPVICLRLLTGSTQTMLF
jgi:hypothetical protein